MAGLCRPASADFFIHPHERLIMNIGYQMSDIHGDLRE
jgi:hypothetical protein